MRMKNQKLNYKWNAESRIISGEEALVSTPFESASQSLCRRFFKSYLCAKGYYYDATTRIILLCSTSTVILLWSESTVMLQRFHGKSILERLWLNLWLSVLVVVSFEPILVIPMAMPSSTPSITGEPIWVPSNLWIQRFRYIT